MFSITIHTSSLDALKEKLSGLLPGGETLGKAVREAAALAQDAVKTRIHEQGLAADGSDIGQYSTNSMYVNVSTAIGGSGLGQPVGKTGKTIFAGGKKKGQQHKTAYLAKGYTEYKQKAGGNNYIGKVNLVLSGELKEQFALISTSEGHGLGWEDENLFTRAEALEEKYGKVIWGLTSDELVQCIAVAEKSVTI